jgi:hypothetical protein
MGTAILLSKLNYIPNMTMTIKTISIFTGNE